MAETARSFTSPALQSKGLEFDDVFIVNFFSESPCKDEWRVLLQVGEPS